MMHCRLEIPEELRNEAMRIWKEYYAMRDPEADVNEEEWQAFYAARASEALKAYDREGQKTREWAKKNDVLV